MPARKGYSKKKKQQAPGRMQIYGAAGSQLVKDVALLKSLINTETKYIDTTASLNITSGGVVVPLNLVAQGDSATTREGNSVKNHSLAVRYTAYWNTASAIPFQWCRFIVVHDLQCNGVLPNINTILQTVNYQSPKNDAGRQRYKTLSDKTYSLSQQGQPNIDEELYMKLGDHTNYGLGNAGTIADISTGAYYLVMIADVAANGPGAAWYTRMRFIDN